MKKLIIIAEASLTDNQARKILEKGKVVWNMDKPIATLQFLGIASTVDIKFKSASIIDGVDF